MNKCAFVIPIHPKHFSYVRHILESLIGSDADIWFVFTSSEEKALLDINLPYNSLCLTDFTDLKIVEKTNSYITIKKYYALSILKDKYEYISCIDAEIKFLKKDGFYEMMKTIADSKKIYGSFLPEASKGRNIIYASILVLVPEDERQHLVDISKNFHIYTWWSNIPVYDSLNLDHFLKWIKFNNTEDSLSRFQWSIFDNMLYNYYCVRFHEYRILLDERCDTSFELLSTAVIEDVDKTLKLYWVNNSAFIENPYYYLKNGFYIVFHRDREELK